MANLAEQARAEDGSPGRWLVRVTELAEHLIDSDSVRLPLFIAGLAALSEADESQTRRAYLDGVSTASDPEARTARLALAAASCAVVPEPCVWLAHLAWCRGDLDSTRSWAACAVRRQLELGTVWDKRLSFDEWLQVSQGLERATEAAAGDSSEAIVHPRALLQTIKGGETASSSNPVRRSTTGDPAAASVRFHRYVESLARADGAALGAVYPDLVGRPWYDPQAFPLVRYLESHYDEIRDEILSLDPSRFQRESEPIARSGDWDVAFFYERGQRHDETCLACPVTARGVEAYRTVRSLAGLIYASRMRGATHISPHRGPTNLRIRCHLALRVPEGDCAIRVGSEARRWEEGKCLVFDDFFEHEAWNHTDEDRIVLVVDMWHPDLSTIEIDLLTGLQRYANSHARRLGRYWSTNASARQAAGVES
jgi:aspartyl/asparaginyl beta-hydroxylase (cupin superfamily)